MSRHVLFSPGVLVVWGLLSSVLSTAVNLLALGVMGYVAWFILHNKIGGGGGGGDGDDGPGGDASDSDLSLREARKIMEKYK